VATLLTKGEDRAAKEVYKWIKGVRVEVKERGAMYK
jgi:hypothetical protein